MIQCFGKYQHIFFLQNNNFTKRIKIEIGVVKVFMKSNRLQKILPIFDEKKKHVNLLVLLVCTWYKLLLLLQNFFFVDFL